MNRHHSIQKEALQRLLVVIFLGLHCLLSSQVQVEDVLSNYEQNGTIPREIVYLHLNKNTFLEGEQLAYKGYLWDRTNKRPANTSKNLYVRLKSNEGQVLDEQMVFLKTVWGLAFLKLTPPW